MTTQNKKIIILPNDQSWVGKIIRADDWPEKEFIKILYVGKEEIFASDTNSEEDTYSIIRDNSNWELYEEPEEKTEGQVWHEVIDKVFKGYKQEKQPLDISEEPEETYEKITDEFQTKILNKFEKFVDGEHRGHHCSGKCTKLPAIDPQTVKEKDKECEHEWDTSRVLISVPPTYKCKKCPALELVSDVIEQNLFWLKVGDKIKRKLDSSSYGSTLKVLNIVDCKIQVMAFAEQDLANAQWFSFEEFERDVGKESDFKKIKLVSPALVKYPQHTQYQFSEFFYEERPSYYDTTDIKYIWPAKDQFGKEIWYEV